MAYFDDATVWSSNPDAIKHAMKHTLWLDGLAGNEVEPSKTEALSTDRSRRKIYGQWKVQGGQVRSNTFAKLLGHSINVGKRLDNPLAKAKTAKAASSFHRIQALPHPRWRK
jgi:hypothetical protein